MPRIRYPTPLAVKPAATASEIECAGVHYRFAPGQPATVTYYFEATSNGVMVDRMPVNLPLASPEVERLQRDALKEAKRVYPDGPVV